MSRLVQERRPVSGLRRPVRLLPLALLGACALLFSSAVADVSENFRRENLVVWCVAPFDAKNRPPHERTGMLERLGIRRVAYDWREEHVSEFESEFLAYRDRGIELAAFWRGHPEAEAVFARLGLKPQIWVPLQSGKGLSNKEKIGDAAKALVPLAERTAARGLALGLCNQGGWGGLPDNLVEVCEALQDQGFGHVGIVYNFHHAHPRIASFADDLKRMMPRLLCVSLNGMADPAKVDVSKKEHRIKPLGGGEHEAEMIAELLAQGYTGAVAILGHVSNRGTEEALRENLEGLEKILAGLPAKPSAP